MHIERPLSCTCPPLSHVHSPIGTTPRFYAVKKRLQKPLRLPSAFTVNPDLDGAILDHRLQHERPLQWGRNGMKGKTIGESVFVNHWDLHL